MIIRHVEAKFSPLYHQRFTKEEDARIIALVQIMPRAWDWVAMGVPGRTGSQVRARYFNFLRPEHFNDWTPMEHALLRAKVHEYGVEWSLLKPFFPNKTTSSIRSHWTQMMNRYNRKGENFQATNRRKKDATATSGFFDIDLSEFENPLATDPFADHVEGDAAGW
jgi:hypothetical protein